MIDNLIKYFTRDLNKLRTEIEAYQNESKIWYIEKSIANSAGNLCLHLVGNLNHFIGAELGKTNYKRNRDLEFSLKDIPRVELVRMINETIIVVVKALEQLKEDDLQREYPLLVFEEKTSIEFLLMHLSTHLAYHLGQINYHRRLLDSTEINH